MISSIDIISHDTRPADTAPQIAVSEGPSFAERLSKAEESHKRADEAAAVRSEEPAKRNAKRAEEPESSSDRSRAESAEKNQTEKSASREETVGKERAAGDSRAEKAAKKSGADESRKALERPAAAPEKSGEAETAAAAEAVAGSAPEASSEIKAARLSEENGSETRAEDAVAHVAVEGEKTVRSEQSAAGEPLTAAETANQGSAALTNAAGDRPDARKEGSRRHNSNRPERVAGESASASKQDRPRIEVRDLRERGTAAAKQGENSGDGLQTRNAGFAPANQTEGDAAQRQEIMVLETAGARPGTQANAGEAAPSRAAGELAKALREGGNEEILKKAQFLLKDNDRGEIRLILKPERLGEVRIRLNMNDRHIAGRIIVENNSVREAFQENLEALNRAFRDSGYQTAGLEVSVGGRERDGGARRRHADAELVSSRSVELLDEQVPRIESDLYPTSRVNVYV